MTITVGTIEIYDSYKRELQNKNIDIDSDTFVVGLSTSAYTPDKSAHEVLADITNEVSGNGYARQILTGVTLTEPSPGIWRFNSDDPIFIAAGGSIVARYWWMFNDSSVTPLDMLCFYGLLDDTPDDVTTVDTDKLTIQVNVNGYTDLS